MDIPQSIIESFVRKVEFLLIAIVEHIEGRVPTDKEINVYGERIFLPNGSAEYRWKGKTVLTAELHFKDGAAFGDFSAPPEIMNNEYIKERLNDWTK